MSGVRPWPIANSVATPPGHTFVHRTPQRPQLVVERAREPHLRELRRAVDGLERQSAPPRLGRERDDVGGVAAEQVRERRAHRVHRPLHVRVDHVLEVLLRELEERAVRTDPGVGDHDVEPAEPLHGRSDQLRDRDRIAHVAGLRDRALDPQIAAAPRRQAHMHTRARKGARDRRTDPSAGTGDERHLPFQVHHRSLASSRRIATAAHRPKERIGLLGHEV